MRCSRNFHGKSYGCINCALYRSHKEYSKDENKMKETIKIVLCYKQKYLSRLKFRFSKSQTSKN